MSASEDEEIFYDYSLYHFIQNWFIGGAHDFKIFKNMVRILPNDDIDA